MKATLSKQQLLSSRVHQADSEGDRRQTLMVSVLQEVLGEPWRGSRFWLTIWLQKHQMWIRPQQLCMI